MQFVVQIRKLPFNFRRTGIQDAKDVTLTVINAVGQIFAVRHLPVGNGKFFALFSVPCQIFDFAAVHRFAFKELAAQKDTQPAAELYEPAGKFGKVFAAFAYSFPSHPGNGIVLTIRIVVAHLGMGELVSGNQHRRAKRQKQRCQHGAGTVIAVVPNGTVCGFAFLTGIPAPVGIRAVAVVFAVGLVMLMIVTDQITQAKTIMRRYKINAGPDITVVVIKDIAGTGNAAGKLADLIFVAFPKTADNIAVFVIPFRPARRESPDLITADADIPRLGNQFDFFQHRILRNGV